MLKPVLALATLVGSALVASQASAGGFSMTYFGGIDGHPNADGGLALYWNPARTARDGGAFFTFDANVIQREATYDRILTEAHPRVEDPDEIYFELNQGEGHLLNTALLPYLAGGYVIDTGRLHLAFSLGEIPAFAGGSNWDPDPSAPAEYPGAYDGPQRWNAITSSITILHHTAGFAIRDTRSGFSGGVSVAYVTGELHTSRARNLNASDAIVDTEGNLQEGRIYFTGTDEAMTASVGVSYERDDIAVSMHYRPAYRLELIGPLYGVYTTSPPGETEAYLEFKLPHIVQTAVSLGFGPLTLTGMTDYTVWSDLNYPTHQPAEGLDACPGNDALANATRERLLCIPRNYQDTLTMRGIAAYTLNPAWTVTGTLGFDPASIPIETYGADLPDPFKLRVGVGGRYQANEHLLLRASFQHDFINEIEVTNSIQEPTANGIYNERREYLQFSVEGSF